MIAKLFFPEFTVKEKVFTFFAHVHIMKGTNDETIF